MQKKIVMIVLFLMAAIVFSFCYAQRILTPRRSFTTFTTDLSVYKKTANEKV